MELGQIKKGTKRRYANMDIAIESKWMIVCLKLVLVLVVSSCCAEIYTSSKKIEDMVLQEESLLNNFYQDISSLGDGLKMTEFTRFYNDRMDKVRERSEEHDLQEYLKHPNGIYQSIKEFATQYKTVITNLASSASTSVQAELQGIATQADLDGARMSFIRLQEVYGLTASEMVKGNYKGFQGPPLDALDALQIARTAFTGNKYDKCEDWLQTALDMIQNEGSDSTHFERQGLYTADVLGLLGRVKLRLGNKNEAMALYKRSVGLPAATGDVGALKQELDLVWPRFTPNEDASIRNFSRLCSLQQKLSNGNLDPRLRCSYRVVRPAYNRFKMELISITPYVIIFHEVITDEEINHVLSMAREKLFRAHFQANDGVTRNTGEFRVSDTGFLYDSESPVTVRIGKRVSLITGLNTSQPSSYVWAGEPLQVVNYGMGGHYGVHMDSFQGNMTEGVHANGNRMATFLIYLTNVQSGGSTAFTELDLVVPPLKKSALFWYSMWPSGEIDFKTSHAGCPVIVGHKWVTNKWVWTHGNTFFRRCGRRRTSTQWSIERHMLNGWK